MQGQPPGGFDGKLSPPSGPYGAPPPRQVPGFAPAPPGPAPMMPMMPGGYGVVQTHPLGIASLTCGILAYPTTCCCNLASVPLAISAVVCGIVGLTRIKAHPETYSGNGLCIAGIVMGGLGLLLGVGFLALGFGSRLWTSKILGMP